MPYTVTRKKTISALSEHKNGVTLFAELHRTLQNRFLIGHCLKPCLFFVRVISAEEGARIRSQSEKLNSLGNRVKYSRYGGLQRHSLFRRSHNRILKTTFLVRIVHRTVNHIGRAVSLYRIRNISAPVIPFFRHGERSKNISSCLISEEKALISVVYLFNRKIRGDKGFSVLVV